MPRHIIATYDTLRSRQKCREQRCFQNTSLNQFRYTELVWYIEPKHSRGGTDNYCKWDHTIIVNKITQPRIWDHANTVCCVAFMYSPLPYCSPDVAGTGAPLQIFFRCRANRSLWCGGTPDQIHTLWTLSPLYKFDIIATDWVFLDRCSWWFSWYLKKKI